MVKYKTAPVKVINKLIEIEVIVYEKTYAIVIVVDRGVTVNSATPKRNPFEIEKFTKPKNQI